MPAAKRRKLVAGGGFRPRIMLRLVRVLAALVLTPVAELRDVITATRMTEARKDYQGAAKNCKEAMIRACVSVQQQGENHLGVSTSFWQETITQKDLEEVAQQALKVEKVEKAIFGHVPPPEGLLARDLELLQ